MAQTQTLQRLETRHQQARTSAGRLAEYLAEIASAGSEPAPHALEWYEARKRESIVTGIAVANARRAALVA